MFYPAHIDGRNSGKGIFIPGVAGELKARTGIWVEGLLRRDGSPSLRKEIKFADGFTGIPLGAANNKFTPITKETVPVAKAKPDIAIQDLRLTHRRIRKVELMIPHRADCFDNVGGYQETFSKGKKVLFDTEKPIFSRYNPMAGRYEAFLAIKGYFEYQKGKESIEPKSGFVRATWLDRRIQEERPSVSSGKTQTFIDRPTFSGYLGPDGREIPSYILEAVTVNYFGKVLAPKVAKNIETIDTTLRATRFSIESEFMNKGISIKNSPYITTHKAQLDEKGKMEKIQYAIKSFTLDTRTVVSDPNVSQVLSAVKRTPEWQKVIQNAASIARNIRIRKSGI